MLRIILVTILLSLSSLAMLVGQSTAELRGVVTDSISGEPLSNVSLRIEGTPYGTVTDSRGRFVLRRSGLEGESIHVRHIGYATSVILLQGRETDLHIRLSQEAVELGDFVIVRPRRNRYVRRNNPAVDLIRKVIDHKDDNRIEAAAQYKMGIYDRLTLSFAKTDSSIGRDLLVRKLPFIRNYMDTSALTGYPVLTLSIREQLSDHYYRRSPQSSKTIVRANRHEGLDQQLDDSGILAGNVDEILKGINILDNDVNILLNRFVSPLSSTLGTVYYKYFILDTIDVGTDPCVMLAFAPFNSESYAFTGYLYILLDGTYAIRKVQLNVPRHINLNWVRRLRIDIEYDRISGNLWSPKQEDIYADFTAMPGATDLYAHRLRRFEPVDLTPHEADSVFALRGPTHVSPGANRIAEERWDDLRPIPLSEKEQAVGNLQARLDSVLFYRIMVKTLGILIADYIPTDMQKGNSRFDFGPTSSIYSSNYLEGSRFRIGGMTTARLFPKLFASGYAAYGLSDRKLKYQATLTYSFIPRDYHHKESPANNLSVLYGFDVGTPGQQFLSGNDNLILSQSVGQRITHMQYIRKAEVRYEKEWPNHLYLSLWTRHENNRAAGNLQYIDAATKSSVSDISTTEIGFQLRYAPGERPYNGRDGRDAMFNLSKDAPVFRLSHRIGIKALLAGDFTYHHTELGVEKRIWLSSFGHIDAIARGGYIWNRLPFPLLIIPNTNQSAVIQPETFTMMRAMEFVSDKYASVFLTYYMKGWIFNRIPLIKHLQLREVISFAATYGHLSDKNDPTANPRDLFLFPQGTTPFSHEPYIEVSAGIENILNIIRIDYYRRLTYLNRSDINRGGFRIGFRFSF